MPRQKPTNSRRMTLGVIDSNVAKTSSSIDVSGAVSDSKPRQPRGRNKSMIPRMGGAENQPANAPNPAPNGAPNASRSTSSSRRRSTRASMGVDRRMSVGGNRRQSHIPQPGSAARPDPRPINDKAYQNECIRKLYDFLKGTGYDYPLSLKSLSRPSGKDFTNIMTFMLRLADPSFQDGSMKFEDEVSMNFRNMGYPFPVSKTALVAAGSHSWPSLLAALTWLMEHLSVALIEYPKSRIDEDKEYSSLQEIEEEALKLYHSFLGDAYNLYLEGEEQKIEELENAFLDRFDRDEAIIGHQIHRIRDEYNEICEAIRATREGWEEIEAGDKRKQEYDEAIAGIGDILLQLEEKGKSLAAQEKDLSAKIAENQRQMAKSTENIARLEETVTKQLMTLDDLNKLQFEMKINEESIERCTKSKAKLIQESLDADSSIQKVWDELESAILEYDSNLTKLVKVTTVASKSIDMKLKSDKSFAEGSLNELLNADLVGVQQCLADCRHELSVRTTELKSANLNLLDDLSKSEQEYALKIQNAKHLKDRCSKFDETIAADKKSQEAKLEVRMREVASMEEQIAAIQDPSVSIEEQKAEIGRKCTELEVRRNQVRAAHSVARRAVCAEIERALSKYQEHNEYVQEKIAQVKRYVRESKDSYDELEQPVIIEKDDC